MARDHLIKSKNKSKEYYDEKENAIGIHVKDKILLRDNTQKNKLNPLWIGPYEVLEVLDKENIIIQRGRRRATVHKNNIKKYFVNPD